MTALLIFGSIILIGLFITVWMYMYYCADNGLSPFANPRYSERIYSAEKKLKELEDKINGTV